MVLELNNLSKTYPNGVKAMNGISLKIRTGMFGLLGPNGAGKSSLMRTIATLQDPDDGTVIFNEFDVHKDKMLLRQQLGYLPQEFGVYPRVSAEKLLDYLARLKGVSNKKERQELIDYSLNITNLTEAKKKAVSSFSGGMKQRFGIAQMLLNSPKIIIVDEPTAGLDPAERQRFLNILREISSKSIVIFSTHIVDDIKELCTDMAILNNGEIQCHLPPDQAMADLHGNVFTVIIDKGDFADCESKYQVLSSSFNRFNKLVVRVYANEKPTVDFVEATTNLEDVYFSVLKEFTHSKSHNNV